MADRLNELIKYCSKDEKVCPSPICWHEMYQALDKATVAGDSPPPPLILSAWWATDDSQKADCLEQQLAWASTHGVFDIASDFLLNLPDEKWHLRDRPW
jgi:hypothetical protein